VVFSQKGLPENSSKAVDSSSTTLAPTIGHKGGKARTKKDTRLGAEPVKRSISPALSATAGQLPLTVPDTPLSATMDSDDDMQSVASSAGFMEDADSDISLDDGKFYLLGRGCW